MASKKVLNQVSATLIVVKIGKTEMYLKKNSFLPPGVEREEINRLKKLDLIKAVTIESDEKAEGTSDGDGAGGSEDE